MYKRQAGDDEDDDDDDDGLLLGDETLALSALCDGRFTAQVTTRSLLIVANNGFPRSDSSPTALTARELGGTRAAARHPERGGDAGSNAGSNAGSDGGSDADSDEPLAALHRRARHARAPRDLSDGSDARGAHSEARGVVAHCVDFATECGAMAVSAAVCEPYVLALLADGRTVLAIAIAHLPAPTAAVGNLGARQLRGEALRPPLPLSLIHI